MRFGYLALLLASAAVIYSGCAKETEDFTIGDPEIDLRVTGPCAGGATAIAGNAVPTITEDEFREGMYSATGRITVNGVDQRTATGDLKPDTRVRLSFVDPDHALIAGFVSSMGLEDQSALLSFSGRTATDEIFCLASGTVFIKATIENYIVEDPGVDRREIQMVSRPFPVDCKTPEDFERECSGLPPIDAGVGTDMGVEDMGTGDNLPSWSINFIPPASEDDLVIGIRGSGLGRPDSVVLTFQVRDLNQAEEGIAEGLPSLRVLFSLPDNHPPNVSIEPAEAFTDARGQASVRLIAGGTPGVVSVRAEAEVSEGETIEARSATVVIRGGIPSMRGFQFRCADSIIAGFTRRFDADDWLLGQSQGDGSACSAQLADRVTGRVDLATQVFFLTEAGSVDQARATDENGVAITNLRVGPPHPFDTSPEPYEAEAADQFVDTPFNPRDGLVTLVALTRGEEDFLDTNGNKIYEDGIDILAPEHDLAEPYVDVNDNGDYDQDERTLIEEFRDTDRDGFWSIANGVWDSDTEIWTSTTILWTGMLDWEASEIQILCEPPGCDPEIAIMPACEGTDADLFLQPGGVIELSTRYNDRNGNCLDAYHEGVAFVELNGALDLPHGISEKELAGRCFEEGMPNKPMAPTDSWVIVDTSNPDEESAFIGTVTYGVTYRTVAGNTVTESRTLLTCR